MNWMVCTVEDQLPALLEGILRSTPDPAKINMPEDKAAVMRIMALEY